MDLRLPLRHGIATSMKYIQKVLLILVFNHKILFISIIGITIETFNGRKEKNMLH